MATPSDITRLKNSFFHSIDKTMVLNTMDSYESQYKSGHVIKLSDIIGIDLPNINMEEAVDSWMYYNPNVLTKFENQPLTVVPNTNGQSWYINSGGWQLPIVLNTLVTDPVSNNPSLGYVFELYQENGQRIGEGSGKWFVNPYQGIVYFDSGFTPSDLGWGIPKVKCYVYIGDTLSDVIDKLRYDITNHTHTRVNTHKITINEGETPTDIRSFDMWVSL